MNNTQKLVAFDFDGTIADTVPAIAKSYNNHSAEYNLPTVSPAEFDHIREIGVTNFIKTLKLSPLKLFALVQQVQQDMRESMDEINPFADMPKVLRQLHKQYQLAIITSNQEDNVLAFLHRHNLSELFSEVRCEKEYFGKAKIIKKVVSALSTPENSVYIGDETRDIAAATDAGIPAIAVTWGFDLENILATVNPQAIAHKPTELPSIVRKLLG